MTDVFDCTRCAFLTPKGLCARRGTIVRIANPIRFLAERAELSRFVDSALRDHMSDDGPAAISKCSGANELT